MDTVGTGLPETLRGDQQGGEAMAAAALIGLSRAKTSQILASARNSQGVGEAGPSTAAHRAATGIPAASEPSSMGIDSDRAGHEGAGDGANDQDDEGQPPKKRQRLDDDNDDDDDDDDADEEKSEVEAEGEDEEDEKGGEEGGDEEREEEEDEEGNDRLRKGRGKCRRESNGKGKGKEKASR